MTIGQEMHALVSRLFPICRSITGDGVRETLRILREHAPIRVHEVPSGFVAFDWKVPPEWNIRDAYVLDPDGRKVIDFQENNLHVVGYSRPVNTRLPLKKLQKHLHSRPDLPAAIPYVTSYYAPRWGFCLAHNERKKLQDGTYTAVIDSDLDPNGHLTYGEIIIPGKTDDEIFLSTYVCHPSMANNELSGPIVTTFLVKWLLSEPRRYTYRIAYVPETIGALVYLRHNLHYMRARVKAGFVVTCVGDTQAYSFLPSRKAPTLADRAAITVINNKIKGKEIDPCSFRLYSYLNRGSDERQYCAPGVDLPVCSVMRSKYGTYPEYHTSLDDLSLVTPAGLQGGYEIYRDIIELLERNRVYQSARVGEPFMSKYGLYPTLSTHDSAQETQAMMDFLAYADGKNDVIAISAIIKRAPWELYSVIEKLKEARLIHTDAGWGLMD